MAHWRNLNTYLALLQKNRKAQDIPVLSGTVRLALRALPMALEHSPETRLGKNAELHAPAAAQWLRLAVDEIEELCAERNERMVAGDLWVAKGGSDVCDLARLQFWKERLPQVMLDGDSV